MELSLAENAFLTDVRVLGCSTALQELIISRFLTSLITRDFFFPVNGILEILKNNTFLLHISRNFIRNIHRMVSAGIVKSISFGLALLLLIPIIPSLFSRVTLRCLHFEQYVIRTYHPF